MSTGVREPLTIEQVAKVLKMGVPAAAKAATTLGLTRVKSPSWCTDRRETFYDPESVLRALETLEAGRQRLAAARRGELPPSWADFQGKEPAQK